METPDCALSSARDYSASMTEKPRTPALQEAAKRRRTLHEALVGTRVRHLLPGRGPDPGLDQPGDQGGHRGPRRLGPARGHHREARRPLRGDRRHLPRLAGTIDRLRDEHPDITHAVGQMLSRLEQVEIGGLPWPLDDARDDLQRFIGKVIRHRQKGADLVWEAYNLDIGGPE